MLKNVYRGGNMEKISEEELNHVANLARLNLSDTEKEKYAIDFVTIMNDIEKLNRVDLSDVTDEIMISPTTNINEYHYVDTIETTRKEEALKNSKLSDGDYIVVPQVIHD